MSEQELDRKLAILRELLIGDFEGIARMMAASGYSADLVPSSEFIEKLHATLHQVAANGLHFFDDAHARLDAILASQPEGSIYHQRAVIVDTFVKGGRAHR